MRTVMAVAISVMGDVVAPAHFRRCV